MWLLIQAWKSLWFDVCSHVVFPVSVGLEAFSANRAKSSVLVRAGPFIAWEGRPMVECFFTGHTLVRTQVTVLQLMSCKFWPVVEALTTLHIWTWIFLNVFSCGYWGCTWCVRFVGTGHIGTGVAHHGQTWCDGWGLDLSKMTSHRCGKEMVSHMRLQWNLPHQYLTTNLTFAGFQSLLLQIL